MRRVGCTLMEVSSRTTRLRPRPLALHRAFATASHLHESENDTQLSSSRTAKHGHCHYLYYHSNSHHDSAGSEGHKRVSREFEKPRMDASFLVNNYTAPALAAAYQDREYTLWLCAELLSEGKLDELEAVLKPYHDFAQLGMNAQRQTPLASAFGQRHLERIRKRLSRLPRQITKAYSARAAVVIPLCTFEGEPSVLFTLRSLTVGKHKGEVCFPGGMVDPNDSCIEGTCLREMNEEVGLAPEGVDVLGVLRCDWSSVTSITGIAVTPVVGFIGEMSDRTVAINEQEVESLFTVPLRDLMNQDNWVRHSNATPVFTGGPHVVWGLTAYLLDICLSEVLQISD
uniref:Nudix hydrolase domain-containing protein n=1 Tax=Phytophthora ramorum TaxID=164328 RepID=H3H315_PHYRM